MKHIRGAPQVFTRTAWAGGLLGGGQNKGELKCGMVPILGVSIEGRVPLPGT